MTSKLLLIYCIGAKPNLDPCASLKYLCRLSVYFAESNNILFRKIDITLKQYKNGRSHILRKYQCIFSSMNCTSNFIVKTIPEQTRHSGRQGAN